MMNKGRASRLKKGLMICSLVLISTIILSANNSFAETSKYRIYSYITKMEVMPFGFMKAPANGVFERRGLVSFENGDVGLYLARGTFKATPKGGTAEGFSQITHSDGSTVVQNYNLSYTKSPDTKLNIYTGTGKVVSGTGRFEGIKGENSVNGQALAPYDKDNKADSYFDVISNYTLPSK
jgi:hypothetical protein